MDPGEQIKEFDRKIGNLDRRRRQLEAVAYAIKHCTDSRFDKEEFQQQFWDILKRTYGED